MRIRITRTRLALGATALLAALVIPLSAATARDSGPDARASASVKKQIKKLKTQVAALQEQVSTVEKQPGPPGPRGATGATGEQGPPGPSTGPAGGDLTGTFPDPSIAFNAVTASKIDSGAVATPEIAESAVTPDQMASSPAAQVAAPNRSGVCLSTIPTATPTTLTFQSETYDTAGMFDNSVACTSSTRARLTAPEEGVYLVSAGVLWEQNSTGTRYLGINRNGSAIAADERQANGGAGAGSTLQTVTTSTVLDAGQFVTAEVNQTSGGTLEIPESDARNYLSAVWIAPEP